MGLLHGRRLLLGVGGGIAAYKAPELVRRLREAGADVRVVLTDAGAEFVSELALEVVSEAPVGRALWAPDGASRIVHTDLGKSVDLIVLAPATANLIGKIRHGLADDLLTTTVMACRTPVLLCPSMNSEMLDNPLVRANIDALAALERYTVLEPGAGLLACGVVGPGRLPDPPEIIEAIVAALTPPTLAGVRVTVSAGPTREALDPVRFLTNRSSGTMGYALARAFAARGAVVTLVSGPTGLRTPVGVARRVDITSAAEAATAVGDLFAETDVLVMSAAIADYRPSAPSPHKLKKAPGPLFAGARAHDRHPVRGGGPPRARRASAGRLRRRDPGRGGAGATEAQGQGPGLGRGQRRRRGRRRVRQRRQRRRPHRARRLHPRAAARFQGRLRRAHRRAARAQPARELRSCLIKTRAARPSARSCPA
jgi:phosphopantothenoylcysteine decarboxylase/phosphopantothenate--cysteine ligase